MTLLNWQEQLLGLSIFGEELEVTGLSLEKKPTMKFRPTTSNGMDFSLFFFYKDHCWSLS